MPDRRYNEFIELLEHFHDQQYATATQEVISEQPWDGLQLVAAHDPRLRPPPRPNSSTLVLTR